MKKGDQKFQRRSYSRKWKNYNVHELIELSPFVFIGRRNHVWVTSTILIFPRKHLPDFPFFF
jgi:hypothetical protein